MKSIVLIHGLFLTKSSWQNWVDRYAARGFNVTALAWPGLDRSVQDLRADPTPLTDLSIEKVLDALDASIRALDASAVIMGHSFGGLFAQLLAYRGLGSAGGGHRCYCAGGRFGAALLDVESIRSGACQPAQYFKGDNADGRAIPLRLYQHAIPG